MKFRYFNSLTKVYESTEISLIQIAEKFKLLRSFSPKTYFIRTPILVYIAEFLKCDGTVSIRKKKDGFVGELIFSTLDESYDGFGVSLLSLAILLSHQYQIPVGKKTEMSVTEPRKEEEARMILRAVIDTEGNVDDYEARITIGNQSRQYLESYKKVLKRWFEIKCSDFSPTKGWGEKTYRIGITRDNDLIKILKIGLLNPTKQRKLKYIVDSLEKYRQNKVTLMKEIEKILIEPKTIRELSNFLDIAPFVIRKLLNSMKAVKYGKIKRNNRIQILWALRQASGPQSILVGAGKEIN